MVAYYCFSVDASYMPLHIPFNAPIFEALVAFFVAIATFLDVNIFRTMLRFVNQLFENINFKRHICSFQICPCHKFRSALALNVRHF